MNEALQQLEEALDRYNQRQKLKQTCLAGIAGGSSTFLGFPFPPLIDWNSTEPQVNSAIDALTDDEVGTARTEILTWAGIS